MITKYQPFSYTIHQLDNDNLIYEHFLLPFFNRNSLASYLIRANRVLASEGIPVVRAPIFSDTWKRLVTDFSSINLSGILFSVITQTLSDPLTPIEVKPLVLTALKAYSRYYKLITNLVESAFWWEESNIEFVALAGSTHYLK